MTRPSSVDADSLLAIDVGEVTTRALLFDAVEGRYRFLAGGSAPTTAGAPFQDASEGVHQALDRLQEITGRILLNEDEQLIIPSLPEGSGVDTFVATFSAGPPLKAAAVGLLENVSLESAKNLLGTTYARVAETLSLNDRRKPEAQIDAFLRLQPDLIVLAGGTNGGASRSVLKLIQSLSMALSLMPEEQRPEVLYAGNQDLIERIKPTLEELGPLHLAPNIRPSLDFEQLDPAQTALSAIFRRVRARQILGVQELDAWAGGNLSPTSTAFGRVIRFLSELYKSNKGILGVDVGASATTIASALRGDLNLKVYPQLGLGEGLTWLLQHSRLEDITRWLLVETPDDYVRDYIYNKTIYPHSLPATAQDLSIEEALAREVLRSALKQTEGDFPSGFKYLVPETLPETELIVAAGSVLTKAPTLGQSLLILLDALQPAGITTIVLDQNNLSPALGAAAAVNPLLTVQVLDSSTFLSLGTVISPVGQARHGSPALRIRLVDESGAESKYEVKFGTVAVLPLPTGQVASLHLQPLQRFNIGSGPGRADNLRVVGGALGVVIDARGRPLRLMAEPQRRRESLKKWLWALEGRT